MKYIRLLLLVFLTAFLLPTPGMAGDTLHRLQGAHEHGTATLQVVAEGKNLYLKLITPAINIVGFEHLPKNSEQKEAVLKAIEILKNDRIVFQPSERAKCKASHVKVETGLMKDRHEHDYEVHSEFNAEYRFTCDAPEKLNSIDVYLFKLFKGMDELDAQVISSKGQSLQELKEKLTRIKL